LTSRAQEDQTICKSGTPTVNGSNFLNMSLSTSKMLRITNALMFLETKILKHKMLLFGTDIMALTKDGKFFI